MRGEGEGKGREAESGQTLSRFLYLSLLCDFYFGGVALGTRHAKRAKTVANRLIE